MGKKKRGVCGCLLGREEASESERRVSTLLPECQSPNNHHYLPTATDCMFLDQGTTTYSID